MRIAVHAAWLLAALLVIGSQRLLEMRVDAQGRRTPVYVVDQSWPQIPKQWTLGQVSGVAVDSTGEVTKTGDDDLPYEGGAELAAILSQNERVHDCAPTQWLRYAMGRREEAADSCSVIAVREAFKASGGDLRELVVALAQTDTFLNYRRPE